MYICGWKYLCMYICVYIWCYVWGCTYKLEGCGPWFQQEFLKGTNKWSVENNQFGGYSLLAISIMRTVQHIYRCCPCDDQPWHISNIVLHDVRMTSSKEASKTLWMATSAISFCLRACFRVCEILILKNAVPQVCTGLLLKVWECVVPLVQNVWALPPHAIQAHT